MKPVDQTTFGFPGGNCFSACVASLLELGIDDVPYFMGGVADGKGDDDPCTWFDRFQSWLAAYGLWAVCFDASNEFVPSGLHILSGKSPRGKKSDDLHSVVANGIHVVHDPHKSRDGLLSRKDMTIIIPIDPAQAVQR